VLKKEKTIPEIEKNQSRNEQAKKLFNLPLDQKPRKEILCARRGKTIPEIEKTSPEMNKQKSIFNLP
jgi:hypothetical protein